MTVKLTRNTMTASLARIESQLQTLPQEAYEYWISQTPVKTGNARKQTRLVRNTIQAGYPYAQALDQGRSRQSPDGMSRPTNRYIRDRVKQKIRK